MTKRMTSEKLSGLGGIFLTIGFLVFILVVNSWINSEVQDQEEVPTSAAKPPAPDGVAPNSLKTAPAPSVPQAETAQSPVPMGSQEPGDEREKIIYEKPLNDVILVQ